MVDTLVADEKDYPIKAIIGIDLGDLRHAVCVLDEDGNMEYPKGQVTYWGNLLRDRSLIIS